ncbi:MAG: hypothetical protein WC763_07220, partial [Candidatus Paceibacterota bacterium]
MASPSTPNNGGGGGGGRNWPVEWLTPAYDTPSSSPLPGTSALFTDEGREKKRGRETKTVSSSKHGGGSNRGSRTLFFLQNGPVFFAEDLFGTIDNLRDQLDNVLRILDTRIVDSSSLHAFTREQFESDDAFFIATRYALATCRLWSPNELEMYSESTIPVGVTSKQRALLMRDMLVERDVSATIAGSVMLADAYNNTMVRSMGHVYPRFMATVRREGDIRSVTPPAKLPERVVKLQAQLTEDVDDGGNDGGGDTSSLSSRILRSNYGSISRCVPDSPYALIRGQRPYAVTDVDAHYQPNPSLVYHKNTLVQIGDNPIFWEGSLYNGTFPRASSGLDRLPQVRYGLSANSDMPGSIRTDARLGDLTMEDVLQWDLAFDAMLNAAIERQQLSPHVFYAASRATTHAVDRNRLAYLRTAYFLRASRGLQQLPATIDLSPMVVSWRNDGTLVGASQLGTFKRQLTAATPIPAGNLSGYGSGALPSPLSDTQPPPSSRESTPGMGFSSPPILIATPYQQQWFPSISSPRPRRYPSGGGVVTGGAESVARILMYGGGGSDSDGGGIVFPSRQAGNTVARPTV